ncbi:hypothetical protein AKJ09_04798 [Labilithrix luteola]|uniref:Uncharacterized protein n=1 Tax=Labilithrix luteola TaxID=1391654 RepID=A0A0K1PYB6_9BACT|nr:hypothetical protein [Labilithrix luteola]AKU98134.1 hypothetical protein AKJ09_04798 [Labilithrix luteola]
MVRRSTALGIGGIGGTGGASAASPHHPEEREKLDDRVAMSGEYRVRNVDGTPVRAPYAGGPNAPKTRYATVQMPKVDVPRPPPSGRMLDEELHFERARDSLRPLDLASYDPVTRRATPPPPRRHSSREVLIPPKPPWPVPAPPMPVRRASSDVAVDARAAVVAFAGFGEPPADLFSTPAYAWRVLRRRRRLKQDLELARLRLSADISLYEAALRAADSRAVGRGIALTVFALLLGMFGTLALVHVLEPVPPLAAHVAR